MSYSKEAVSQTKQCVIYARVSSKEQEKEGFSIPSQLKLLNNYAALNGNKVAKEFVDVETAKLSGRTGFTDMVAFLKKNQNIKTLLVEKTDRLYRNLKDWVILEELDLEIHLVKENVVLSDSSRSSEKFMHGIKVLMAKNYIDNLSEETKKGMQEKAEQGIWPSCAPMGYKNVQRDDGKKIIVIDDDIAPLITKIYEWYASGNYSVKEVTRQAKECGLVAKKSKAPLPQATVHKILRNRLYCGEFDWNGQIHKGSHQPIITKELWLHVQDLLEHKLGNRRKVAKHNFAFSGFIRCDTCGQCLIGDIKKHKYIYYRCGGCKNTVQKPYVKESVIEEQFNRVLQTLKFDDDVLQWVSNALKESNQDKQKHHEEAISRLQAQYNKLTARINTMYIDKLDGKISSEFFDTKSAEWKSEQEEILEQIQKHQQANHIYINEGVRLLELAQTACSLFKGQDAAEKRKLLNFVISNSVWDGKNLKAEFKQPFDIIAESKIKIESEIMRDMPRIEIFEKWLPGPDSNQRPIG